MSPFAIDALLSTLPSKWMECFPTAVNHLGHQVSIESCTNLHRGRPLLLLIAMRRGARTTWYMSALHRLALPTKVFGASPAHHIQTSPRWVNILWAQGAPTMC